MIYTDVIYEVGEAGEAPLSVGPSPDSPEVYVTLSAKSDAAKDYWGSINLTMSNEMAVALGHALVRAGSR